MKKLSISLAFVIFSAVIGLGWGLDHLYYEMGNKGDHEKDDLVAYRQLGKALAKTLDREMNITEFVSSWRAANDIDLSLQKLNEVKLPESLMARFSLDSPLILESEQEYFLHFLLHKQELVLILTVAKQIPDGVNNDLAVIFTSLFYLGVLFVISVWLYPLIKNLRRLGNMANAVGEGQLDKRIDIQPTSYISGIEAEFNRMAQRIETLVEDNKLLSNAVSHDLRTPIARLRFGIEALQETQNEKLKHRYMARISRDIEEMENLVSVLLTYARLDQAMVNVEKSELNISELLLTCIDTLQSDSNPIKQQVEPDLKLFADLNYVRMLVNNLICNAQKYGDHLTFVSLHAREDTLVLSIEDDGPGIPDKKKHELLKPFVRGEEQGNSGFGMGLAITNRIVLWHKAKLEVGTSQKLGGAKFTIVFSK